MWRSQNGFSRGNSHWLNVLEFFQVVIEKVRKMGFIPTAQLGLQTFKETQLLKNRNKLIHEKT